MDSATQILNIAERKMRESGYNAVSYRDIAAEMGIKSASLHYHFPKKEDLGVALVKRYSANFSNRLLETTSEITNPKEKLSVLIALFRQAYEEQELICLCAILGAEAPGLPKAVTVEVRAFFETIITWLTTQYEMIGSISPQSNAKSTLALLEGSMIVASVNDDKGVFEAAEENILGMITLTLKK